MSPTYSERNRRSSSRPPQRSRGVPHSEGDYYCSYGPNSHYNSGIDESSSECSSRYSDPPSLRIPVGTRMPRAPHAPLSPTSAPSLDSSSDSPSSQASSHVYPYHYKYGSFSPDTNPEIVDNGYSYTGAYHRGTTHGDHAWRSPIIHPPPPPKQRPPPVPPVPRPAVPNLIIADPEDLGSNLGSPLGGPKAASYLGVDAPPPEPVVEVKTAVPQTPGPTAIEAQSPPYRASHEHPHHYPPRPHPHYHHHPPHPMSPRSWGPEYEEEDEEYDDDDSYEDEGPRYTRRVHRHRSRPRQQVRHVHGRDERESRPRSRSRPRQPPPRSRSRPRGKIPVEMISADHRPRHRHRSRSRHHRHAHRSKSQHRGPPQPPQPQRSAELQAQIDALTVRLNNIMDDSYARDIIAKENIKFDILFKEEGGGPPAAA